MPEILEMASSMAFVLAPLWGAIAFGVGLYEYRGFASGRRFGIAVAIGVSVWALTRLIGAQVIFRDGLGPDSISSTGTQAWSRALEGLPLGLTLAAAPLLIAVWLVRTARPRTRDNESPRSTS